MLITEVGKEITNSMVGLFLDNKAIPQNSKGEVVESFDEKVRLKWIVGETTVQTTIEIKAYDELKEKGIIDDLANHIPIPASLYEPGDLVESDYVSGIIVRKEYYGISKEWWYDVLAVDGVLDTDHDIRYRREIEKDLKPAESVSGESYFKGKDFDITISKRKEG